MHTHTNIHLLFCSANLQPQPSNFFFSPLLLPSNFLSFIPAFFVLIFRPNLLTFFCSVSALSLWLSLKSARIALFPSESPSAVTPLAISIYYASMHIASAGVCVCIAVQISVGLCKSAHTCIPVCMLTCVSSYMHVCQSWQVWTDVCVCVCAHGHKYH